MRNLVNTPFPGGAMGYPNLIECAWNWQARVIDYYLHKKTTGFREGVIDLLDRSHAIKWNDMKLGFRRMLVFVNT